MILQPKVDRGEQEGTAIKELLKDPYILVAAGKKKFKFYLMFLDDHICTNTPSPENVNFLLVVKTGDTAYQREKRALGHSL